VQDVDGLRRNGDSLDPCWKRLRNAGRQMVEDFMAQLGQPFCQYVMEVVARTGWKFARPAAGAIPKAGAMRMIRPKKYPHDAFNWNWSLPKPTRTPGCRDQEVARRISGAGSRNFLSHAEMECAVDPDRTQA